MKKIQGHYKLVNYLGIAFLLMCLSVGGQPNKTKGFAVYILADMEGCSGLTQRAQILTNEGKLRLAEDMNACIEACFEAGASNVIVRDTHGGGGPNVDPLIIDKRAILIQGPTPEEFYKGGIDSCDAMILLGHHAMALTPNAIMAHSFNSAEIQSMSINGRVVGEVGIEALIAAEHKVPVVLVVGDDKVCREAKLWIPGVVTCQVKKSTSTSSGICLPLDKAHVLIAKKTKKALAKRSSIAMIKVNYPATIRWDYIPKGSPRVYSSDFKLITNPKQKERTSDKVEKLLIETN